MLRILIAAAALSLSFVLTAPPVAAQAPATPPLFATTKVEGTENVYIFRYQGHQAMFIVTPAGVIATDPISYGRPQAAKVYIDEIRKITKAPIRYLIYSHHHDDHIAGGNLFKKEGAVIVAHRRAYERLFQRRSADVTLPDQIVDGQRTIILGGTRLDLVYTGRNHSDSTLVMFLPKEKIIFAVDFNSLGAMPSRLAVNDSYPEEWQASLKRTLGLAWERMIPGHPGPGGRLGTRKDMEQQLQVLTDISAEVKKASETGKCFDPATKEVRVPQHATLSNYDQNIEWVIHRWCGYWGRGI